MPMPTTKELHSRITHREIETNEQTKFRRVLLLEIRRKGASAAWTVLKHHPHKPPVDWLLSYKDAPALRDLPVGELPVAQLIRVRGNATPQPRKHKMI